MDACVLLGDMSSELFYEMKKNPDQVLDADRLMRISYLVGIFKALNLLYSEELAEIKRAQD